MRKFIQKVKWFFSEINKILSNQPSFYSKRRIESFCAWVITEVCMVIYFVKHIDMSMGDMAIWSGIMFAVAGFNVYLINKDKKNETSEKKN